MTGVVGSGLVIYGVVAAFSTYQDVYAPSTDTVVHQLFRIAETCMWLLVAMLGVGFLIVARARRWSEARHDERQAARPVGQEDGQPPMVPKSSLPTGSSTAAKQQARETLAAQGHRGRTPAKIQRRRRGWFDGVD